MKSYYIQVEDCQNNPMALVKVKAESELEAKYKALRALHINDNLYIVNRENAIDLVEEDGIIPIDEDGDEIDIEEDEEEGLPSEEEIRRPGGIDTVRDAEVYARLSLEEEYGHAIESLQIEFDVKRIYISNIVWKKEG